ncbi:MAG: hypothetical protein HQ567_27790 [Candidatus Nealsonbacteria bacterium]|nr:hypothetical protein [Candidatus Nealsonbacteria bacterium]
MPQILALEFNDTEARLVVAASRGDRVVIDHAFSVALLPQGPDEDPAKVSVGGRIAAALAARGIQQSETLVAVGRSSIELRHLALPPAPDAELPEMVHFQAIREFAELADDWLLDFVPMADSPEGGRNVLAAAIGPQPVQQIRKMCEAAALTPRRLLLRPCAAASLLARSRPTAQAKVTLLVDLLPDEADLTVVVDRQVVFLRTARLSGDPLQDASASQALLGEIRRTIAAAQNQLGGQRIESIVLYGSGDSHEELVWSIQGSLAAETECVYPFDGLRLGSELRDALPEHPGRFAPLLGMALAELEQTGQAIDFFDPRRPAPPKSRKQGAAVAIAAVATLVLAYFGYGILEKGWVRDDIEALAKEMKHLDEQVIATEKARRAVDELKAWEATDAVWLDELYRLSKEFPVAKKAMVTKMTLSGGSYDTDGDGKKEPVPKIRLEGLASSASSIGEVESELRELHPVKGGGSDPDDSNQFYERSFDEEVFIVGQEKK